MTNEVNVWILELISWLENRSPNNRTEHNIRKWLPIWSPIVKSRHNRCWIRIGALPAVKTSWLPPNVIVFVTSWPEQSTHGSANILVASGMPLMSRVRTAADRTSTFISCVLKYDGRGTRKLWVLATLLETLETARFSFDALLFPACHHVGVRTVHATHLEWQNVPKMPANRTVLARKLVIYL